MPAAPAEAPRARGARLSNRQLAVLEAELAILDEIDSGLDIDALRDVAKAVNSLRRPDRAVLMITHYQARSSSALYAAAAQRRRPDARHHRSRVPCLRGSIGSRRAL